jgi:hypothetical protein
MFVVSFQNYENEDFKQVEFLDYIVLGDGITMDEEKIQTIVDWIAPSLVRDV